MGQWPARAYYHCLWLYFYYFVYFFIVSLFSFLSAVRPPSPCDTYVSPDDEEVPACKSNSKSEDESSDITPSV